MSTDFNSVIAEASSKRTQEKKVEELIQLVVFNLDNEEYAVPIEDLQEIIRIPDIAPVPNAPDFIRGILNLRGSIVVVIDLEKRFRLTREAGTAPTHIIITQIKDSTYGIIVDKVSEVLRVPIGKIQPAPALVSTKIQTDYLKGVAVLGEDASASKKSRLIIILDLLKMLAEEEMLRVSGIVDEATHGTLKK